MLNGQLVVSQNFFSHHHSDLTVFFSSCISVQRFIVCDDG